MSKMIQTKKKGEWFEITIPKAWENLTGEQLFYHVWNASKKEVHLLRMNKEVLLNGKPLHWTSPLIKGERLMIKLFTNKDFGVVPTYMDLNILYEDDHLLVVNKPAGITTHPNSLEEKNTLANGIAFYLQSKGEYRRIRHIHRLDKDTSGAILFAKHSLIGTILDKQLQERKIKRYYLAIVHGIIKNKKGTIQAPIGRDRHHPTKRRVSKNGQEAITHYEVLQTDEKNQCTLVECTLDTGKTHQIRVHLSHLGHPLVGDLLYGGKGNKQRQALHAYKLELIHPFTMEHLIIEDNNYYIYLKKAIDEIISNIKIM